MQKTRSPELWILIPVAKSLLSMKAKQLYPGLCPRFPPLLSYAVNRDPPNEVGDSVLAVMGVFWVSLPSAAMEISAWQAGCPHSADIPGDSIQPLLESMHISPASPFFLKDRPASDLTADADHK